jgi:hypothetical protein
MIDPHKYSFFVFVTSKLALAMAGKHAGLALGACDSFTTIKQMATFVANNKIVKGLIVKR